MPHPSLIRLFSLLMILALMAGCAYVTKSWITPGVNLVGVRPVQVTAEQQTFIVSLNVNNPNDRTLPIIGATYDLEVEGHEVANGAGNLDKQIPAFSEDVVDIEVNTKLMDLIRDVPSLAFSGGEWSYKVSGVLKLAGGYIPVPFSYSGKVEAAQIMGRLMR